VADCCVDEMTLKLNGVDRKHAGIYSFIHQNSISWPMWSIEASDFSNSLYSPLPVGHPLAVYSSTSPSSDHLLLVFYVAYHLQLLLASLTYSLSFILQFLLSVQCPCYSSFVNSVLITLSSSSLSDASEYYSIKDCGTRCQSTYSSAIVSDSLNGCWRPICLVFGTAALCDTLVRSAI